MLVLTRRTEEKIKIGEDVVISILGVEGGVVKIGIDAPKEIAILRWEVFEQIQKENIDAAAKGVDDINEAVDLFKNKWSGEKKE